MQNFSHSSAVAMELLQSCTKPLICGYQHDFFLLHVLKLHVQMYERNMIGKGKKACCQIGQFYKSMQLCYGHYIDGGSQNPSLNFAKSRSSIITLFIIQSVWNLALHRADVPCKLMVWLHDSFRDTRIHGGFAITLKFQWRLAINR